MIAKPVIKHPISGRNSCLQSRALTTAPWTDVATGIGRVQNAVGIDGKANTAWTLTDSDGVSYDELRQDIILADDSKTHCLSLFVLKDSDTTRFPAFWVFLRNGTTQTTSHGQLNTQTGASILVAGSPASTRLWIEDWGLWWRFIMAVTNNSSGNNSARLRFFPARGATLGANDTTATGSVIVDGIMFERNRTRPSNPIVTGASERNSSIVKPAGSRIILLN